MVQSASDTPVHSPVLFYLKLTRLFPCDSNSGDGTRQVNPSKYVCLNNSSHDHRFSGFISKHFLK